MKDADEMLKKEKIDIDKIEVPEELELRLNNALKNKKVHRRTNINFKVKIAAAVIALVFVAYNVDTFAYYGKKLIGYDNVMNGTLSHLNELGKGQSIDKNYIFKNGTIVTLDGIMLDDNQLLAFITVKAAGIKAEIIDFNFDTFVKGAFGNYLINSSVGAFNADKTEINYVCTIEKPHFYDNKMKVGFILNQNNFKETGYIDFKIDRNKAMGHVLKENINKIYNVDENKIKINSISASPVNTVIKGTIQSIVELAADQLNGERIRPNSIDLRLIADGTELSNQSSGMSTDMNGITFHNEFDALPDSVKELKLKLVSFSADHDVKETIELKKDSRDNKLSILGQNIIINRIYESKGDTYITFTSDDSVKLTRVRLMMDQNKVKLEDTASDEYDKTSEGKEMHTRTMHFKGTGEKLKLIIERMTYNKTYNQIIDIPVK